MNKIFRFLTSGESHGKCLNAIIEGIPAGFIISTEEINDDLYRRQQGYGRGERMKMESDKIEIKSGVRHGVTIGSPICLEIKNKDYENWKVVMDTEPVELNDENAAKIKEKMFTKLRPGHADYAGSVKYGFDDLRNVLERSSARKTAIEVAVGSIAKQILKQFGIEGSSKVIQIGSAKSENNDLTDEMKCEIDNAKSKGTTIGGKIEINYIGLPVGLGSYTQYDRAIDGQIAQAVMSIPAIKSVEIGEGVNLAEKLGSETHDAFCLKSGKIERLSNNAGGIEGGMTNGETLVVKATMKAIPTMRVPLPTVDISDMTESEAHFERSDTCAIEACAVVAEAKIAIVLVDEFLTKFGGDSFKEIKAHYDC